MPASMLGAPHTTRTGPSPESTSARRMRSASGCGQHLEDRARRRRRRSRGRARRSPRPRGRAGSARRRCRPIGASTGVNSRIQESGARTASASELRGEAHVAVPEVLDVVDAVEQLHERGRCRSRTRSPVYSSGSMSTALNTLGSTMPQPPSSTQPVREHTVQPAPSQNTHVIANSTDGSVNGKNDGRKRALDVGAEQRVDERLDGAEQVAERDAVVDREPFDLVEHRRVARVERVAAERAAGRDDVDRRRAATPSRAPAPATCACAAAPLRARRASRRACPASRGPDGRAGS